MNNYIEICFVDYLVYIYIEMLIATCIKQ